MSPYSQALTLVEHRIDISLYILVIVRFTCSPSLMFWVTDLEDHWTIVQLPYQSRGIELLSQGYPPSSLPFAHIEH
jgi:hypothetical protein